ncbi:hypothetical protein D3C84_548580 [compost metagenome]
MARIEVVEVEILDQGRRGLDQLGVDGGHDGRHGGRQEDPRQPGGQHLHHQGGHDLVRAVHAGQDGAAQGAGEVHAQHQQGADHGADEDASVQRLAVPVAEAAQGRVGQAHHPDADQDPEAQHEGLGQHVACPLRADQLGIDHLELMDEVRQAVTGDQDPGQQGAGADQHDDALQRIRHHHGAKAADHRVEQHAAGKQEEPLLVAEAGCRLQQAGAADELHHHGGDEGEDDGHRTQHHHPLAAVAGPQHVVDGHRIDPAGDDGELLAKHPQGEPDGGQLDHRQQHPAQAYLVGGARPADEGGGRGVSGHQRHGQHQAAHAAVADEVLLHEVPVAAMAAGPEADPQHQHQIDNEGEHQLKIHVMTPRYPAGFR